MTHWIDFIIHKWAVTLTLKNMAPPKLRENAVKPCPLSLQIESGEQA